MKYGLPVQEVIQIYFEYPKPSFTDKNVNEYWKV